MSVPDSARNTPWVPLPSTLALRVLAFLTPGTFGRIELDVANGRVVSCRITETIKVRDDEPVQLRETG